MRAGRDARTAVDSSVLVAGFASWHEHHVPAQRALAGAAVIGHTLLETYSVLTRLPPPYRVAGRDAATWLDRLATRAPLVPSPGTMAALPPALATASITGGAVYDALIAATAAEAGVVVLSLDGRAAGTYRALGAEFRLLA